MTNQLPEEKPKEDKPQPGLINISFDYPFQLRCPPVIYPIVLESKEIGFVKIEHKEGVVICDKGSMTEDSPEKVKMVRPKTSSVEIKFQTSDGSWVYVEGDENGKIIYPKFFTKVEVIFPINDIRANPSMRENSEYLDKLSKKFFQRFLFAYMYGIGDFAIEATGKTLWPIQRRLKAYKYTAEDEEYLAKHSKDSEFIDRFMNMDDKFVVYPGFETMQGFTGGDIALPDYSSVRKPNCREEDFRKMFKGLVIPHTIEPHLFFIFSAIRRSHMDEEHFLGIVDLATSIEVAFSYFYGMYLVLFDVADNPNKPEKERATYIEKLTEKFDSDIPMQSKNTSEMNTKIRILDALKKRFESVLDNTHTPVADSQDFRDWTEKVWKLRHKIVHSGEQSVTKEQVAEALKITQEIIRKVGFDQPNFKAVFDKLNPVKKA